jgi:Lon protease-like protein
MESESIAMDSLPKVIPIFPLPGILLLPEGQLPLNVFEPRYLTLFRDALASHSVVGMIQPSEVEDDPGLAPLQRIGCLGRISLSSETEDGRLLVNLTGITRFRITQEITAMTPYRQIEADYSPFAADLKAASIDSSLDRDLLRSTVGRYFDALGIEANQKSMNLLPTTALVTQLAMLCPFESIERQAILESGGHKERFQLLIDLMKMACHGQSMDKDTDLWTH